MNGKHFIAAYGRQGADTYRMTFDSRREAVLDLAETFDLYPDDVDELEVEGEALIGIDRYISDEYARITECHCNDPDSHDLY